METRPYSSWLIFGQSGSGKTHLWNTFPSRRLVILCSGGRESGELKTIDTDANKKLVDEVALESTDELAEICEALNGPWKGKYGTVVLDHVTGFQDLKLREHMGLDAIPQKKGFANVGGKKIERSDWAAIGLDVCEKLARFLSVPANRVIVGQERVFVPRGEDDETKTLRGMELLTINVGCGVLPGIAKWLHPACDYNVQTLVTPKMKVTEVPMADGSVEKMSERVPNEQSFCARVGPHDIFMTKFRAPGGCTPGLLENPTYAKLLKIIKGEKL